MRDETKPEANIAELLARTQKPAEEALRLRPDYRGKLEVTPKYAIHRQAAAVALKAIEQGAAKNVLTKAALMENATRIIRRAQQRARVLMKEGISAPIPDRPSR